MFGRLNADGIWQFPPDAAPGPRRPGVLLDRDGVLVKEVHYLRRKEDVVLESGVGELLRFLRGNRIPTVVVTNQSGIARGYYDWPAFEIVQQEIADQLLQENCGVDVVLACPFHPDFTPGYENRHARWRKPGPGMLKLGAELLNLDLSRSCMIGDHVSDIEAAKAAGLPMAIHLMTGHGARTRAAALRLADNDFRITISDDLNQAKQCLASFFKLPQLGI
ncbi:MAG: HAD-IIIA family hydrolase [Rhizomicrobium sp.]